MFSASVSKERIEELRSKLKETKIKEFEIEMTTRIQKVLNQTKLIENVVKNGGNSIVLIKISHYFNREIFDNYITLPDGYSFGIHNEHLKLIF